MTCKNCGEKVEKGRFCPSCGTPLEQVEETAEATQPTEESTVEEATVVEETSGNEKADNTQPVSTEEKPNAFVTVKNKFLALSKNAQMGIIAGAVLLFIIIIILACSDGSRFTFREYGGGNYQQASNYVLYNADGTSVESDEEIKSVLVSADGSVTAFYDNEGTLFVIGKKGAIKIADDVDNAVVSMYGDSIAFVKDSENYVGELYLYNVSKDKSVRIDKEAYCNSLVLSPDGKSIAYVGNCEVEIGWFSLSVEGDLFLSKKGKEGEKLYSDAVPVAITNNGKKVFYVKDSEKLYVNDEKITSDITLEYLSFNIDNTELIYNKDGNSYYYTLKMGDSVKLKGENFYSLIAPENTLEQCTSVDNFSVYTYGIDTFNESLLSIGGSLYYMSDKGDNVERVTSDIWNYQLTEDGKSMLYLDYSGDLQYIKNVTKSLVSETVGDDLEADYFVASENLKKIYFVSGNELFYLNKDKGVRIADDVDSAVYNDKNGVVYFICEDELFYAKKTAKSKERVMGEYVDSLYELGNVVFFEYVEDDDSYDSVFYKMTGKSKTEKIVETDMSK